MVMPDSAVHPAREVAACMLLAPSAALHIHRPCMQWQGAHSAITHTCTPSPHTAPSAAGMLSMDGHCKTLDASADGYLRAEAVGMLLLTTEAEACGLLADGGPHAVVAGSAVNQVRPACAWRLLCGTVKDLWTAVGWRPVAASMQWWQAVLCLPPPGQTRCALCVWGTW